MYNGNLDKVYSEAMVDILAAPLYMLTIWMVAAGIIFLFWIWMLTDCLINEKENKATWTIVIIFLNQLGSFFYFLIKKRKNCNLAEKIIFFSMVGCVSILVYSMYHVSQYGVPEKEKLKIKQEMAKETHKQRELLSASINPNIRKQQDSFKKELEKKIIPPDPTPLIFDRSSYYSKIFAANPVEKKTTTKTQLKTTHASVTPHNVPQKTYIYSWKDEQGTEHYSNVAPSQGTPHTKRALPD